MTEITTIGLDLAKNVLQVHAIGSTGEMSSGDLRAGLR
jgi:hypothetical protein